MLDHDLGPSMLDVLRRSKVCPAEQLTSLLEMDLAGDTPDEDWLRALGALGQATCITRDGNGAAWTVPHTLQQPAATKIRLVTGPRPG